MGHCRIHGKYSDVYSDGCSECQRAEEREVEALGERERAAESREEAARERAERAEEAARERAERAEEHAHQVNNPGEYQCPFCLLNSLKRPARRCPKCHGSIESSYWEAVLAREAEAASRAEQRRKLAGEEHERKRKAHEDWMKSPDGVAAAKAKEEAEARSRQEAMRAKQAGLLHNLRYARRERAELYAGWAMVLAISFWIGIIPLAVLAAILIHFELRLGTNIVFAIIGGVPLISILLASLSIVLFATGRGLKGIWFAIGALILSSVPVLYILSHVRSQLFP